MTTSVDRILLGETPDHQAALVMFCRSIGHEHHYALFTTFNPDLPKEAEINPPAVFDHSTLPPELGVPAEVIATHSGTIINPWHDVLRWAQQLIADATNGSKLFCIQGPVPGMPHWEKIPIEIDSSGHPLQGLSQRFPHPQPISAAA